MKNMILFLGLICIGVAAHASDPTWNAGPKGDYGYTYGTVTVSSASVATISASDATDTWREVYVIHDSSTPTVYEKVGSTITLTTDGWPFQANVGIYRQTNKTVNLQLGAGATALTMRYMLVTKN
jgi:hypothetical protein